MSGRGRPPVSMPHLPLDPVFNALTPVLYADGAHATGFYFEDDGLYLVTNLHVVATEGGAAFDDAVRVITRDPGPDDTVTFHEVPLLADGATWLEHPSDVHVDLVAIPLGFDLAGTDSQALTRGLIPPHEGDMPINVQAMIVGYPTIEQAPYIPFTRDAIVSTPYGRTFRDLPCFATDADMHAGTSGSPVFALPRSVGREKDVLGDRLYLIGVHSATLYSNHPPSQGALDLNVAWYIELLTDILELGQPPLQ